MITATFLTYDFLEDTKDQNPQDYLSQYGTNFTELSKRGLLEQCFSRENDLYQIMEILLRKQKNNPVLVGEPGVGKTALVELFAERIANNDVPFIFQGCDILGIDIAKMLAGAKYRGEFELRLIQLLEQILEENGVIVFFDEIHILKTSGTAEGALDAGNLLKPILSRPGFRCLGATTPKEYKKIEEDAALTRRFHPIIITESSKADTFEILNGLRATLEIYHNVYYTDLALIEAVNLSTKYIGDKALPDKAIDLLDRAGAREALYRSDINYASFFNAILFAGLKKLAVLKIKAFRRDFLEIDAEQYISFEQTLDENNRAKINSLTTLFKGLPPLLHKRYIDALNIDPLEDQEKIEIENIQPSTSLLKKEQENELIYNLLGFFSTEKGRNFLSNTNDPELMRIARKIGDYNLAALDYRIGAYEIQRLVTSLTGIPVESLTESEMQKLLNLENTLHKRVVGQNEAITALSKAIRRSRLGIQNPSRPIGSFLFCGPTGVGKTELSKALSEAIFGSEKEMIRFDMSEFMERFSVTRLIGSPPGYVGYEEGGQLSDAVRKKPYSLVLFDEIEKAHIEVLNILLQILEDGRLTDSQKRLVLFQNTIIIMTSNAAAKEIQLSLESIEKERKRKNEDKNEAIIEKPISKELDNSKKKSLNSSYLDPRLGRIDLIPTIINTNFVVDIRDNIKQTFSGSYTGQLFVNKLYKKFPELNDLNIAKGNDKLVTLSTKKNTSFNKKNNQINADEKIKGLQKKIAQKDVDQTDIKELVMNKLTKFFLPEFINRLDDIIIFESLTYEDILEIYDIMVEKLIKRVKKNKINLLIDPSVKGKLVNEGYSKAFGARPLRRLVTKYLEDTLSTTLLTSRIGDNSKQGCTIRISLNENDIITGQLIS
eukprot:gene11359-12689_t